jgi:Pentapeptide repeats (8 copies)
LTPVDQPTVVHTPGPQTFTADGTDTAANVTYPNGAVTASEDPFSRDEVGEILPSCFPLPPPPPSGQLPATSNDGFRSGGTFPLGVTKLYCNASDNADGQPGPTPPSAILSVTVADQPATLTVPPTYQLARATSSSGATVIYAPGPVTAIENGEADIPLCSANKGLPLSPSDGFISGGSFPVGGTTVTCAAPVNDDPTNPGPPQSFTVIVTNTPCAALAGCNLHGLDLSNAILAGADLSSGTDLSNANLNKADLSGANLSFANLSGANLNKADLTGANLTGAITTGANFNKVTWSNTTCPDGTSSSASTPETCVGHL